MENYLAIEMVVILTKRHDIYHEIYMYVNTRSQIHREMCVLFLILFVFPLFFYSFALVTFRTRFIHLQVEHNCFPFLFFPPFFWVCDLKSMHKS